MKCTYALQHYYSESISVRKKHRIDDHIAECSFCQNEIAKNERIGVLLHHFDRKAPENRGMLLSAIQKYRNKRQEKWWYRFVDRLLIKSFVRRKLVYGAVGAVLIVGVCLISYFRKNNETVQQSNEAEEVDYYIHQHISSQSNYLLSQDSFIRTYNYLNSQELEKKYPNFKK